MTAISKISPAERKKLVALASRFKDKRILVVGDFMLDQYIRGQVSRISPEAPVPVVRVDQETLIPGGAGNVASNLSSLGAKAVAIGVVGPDDSGRKLATILAEKGVDTAHLTVDDTRVTSQKCRVVAERQQVVRYDRETPGALSAAAESRLLERLPAAVAACDALVLSDYGKGVISPRILRAAIALAKRRGVPVTVDPKIEHFRRYLGVTCLTPNTHEAWAGMRREPQAGREALERLGRDIVKTLRCRSLLITRGAEGMSLFIDGRVTHIPTLAREVFDVTGAGDTVISTLTLALASGADVRQAALISNYAAGIVVGKLGTAVTTVPELLGALK